ncbi:ParB/RepB/Spo0J family partition protein [Azospirillum halopraeferens]|uniref:ParB/RepB/Spo0J family partition protein n=1 Tax=Azospirillum halopraeferens TaxID=34010 RepID=UPI0003FA07A0|nr:ParB/RepB/Spo0J family partition protein [Azospirillum halopraeferens]
MPPKFARKPVRTLPASDSLGVVEGMTGVSADFPRLIELSIERIADNPDQPRTVFDEAGLRSLADSIARHGLQQPILVREEPDGDGYRLVAGERRLRAHRMLGRDTIFAIVTTGKPEEVAIIENVQREDLDAVDLARGLNRLVETHGYTQEEAGAVIGCTKAEVNRRLAVLRLPDDILADYRRRTADISRSILVEIAQVDDDAVRRRLWERAKAGLTVREVQAQRKAAAGTAGKDAALLQTLGRSLTRIGKEVEAVRTVRHRLLPEHRERLSALRDEIDALLRG